MKTGYDNDLAEANKQAEDYMNAMVGIVMPVLEQSVVIAAEYSKACGRDVILSEDVEYASRYCAMHKVGQVTGSLFPDVYDEEDSDEEDIVTVPENELPHLHGTVVTTPTLFRSTRRTTLGMLGLRAIQPSKS